VIKKLLGFAALREDAKVPQTPSAGTSLGGVIYFTPGIVMADIFG
jgi:hypothetical protein